LNGAVRSRVPALRRCRNNNLAHPESPAHSAACKNHESHLSEVPSGRGQRDRRCRRGLDREVAEVPLPPSTYSSQGSTLRPRGSPRRARPRPKLPLREVDRQ
jgi:hypothetical protein